MANAKKPRKADRYDIEEKSDEEREAEGGMRATEPGHLGEDRVTELAAEVAELEGHNLTGHDARDEGSHDAGAHADIAPKEWSGAEADRYRRAAKRAETTRNRDPEEERRQIEEYGEPA